MSAADKSLRELGWLEELGEAATLPADDLRRLDVEAKVKERGGQALAHWEALLAEDEAWRGALRDVDVPAGLEQRLRAIPAQNGPRVRGASLPTRRRLLWAAAAVVVLGLGTFLVARAMGGADARIQEVALLALNDHLDTHTQDVVTDDVRELERDLQDHIPFPVHVPALGAGIELVGGRRCTLGSHTVAFTAWRGSAGRLSMVQMRRADFGLPADMTPRVVRPAGDAAQAQPLDVLFFGNDQYVWVVVADDAADLQRVRDSLGNT